MTSADPAGPLPAERRASLAGAIYGQIFSTSTLVALANDDRLGAGELCWAVVATMLVIWIAHVYGGLVADRVVLARRLARREVARAFADDWPLRSASPSSSRCCSPSPASGHGTVGSTSAT